MLNNATRDKPYYPYKSISSLESLSSALDVPIVTLQDLARSQSANYHEFKIEIEKKDGTTKERYIKEPKFALKKIQKRINSRILTKIEYPTYLHGGIKDKNNPRDYYSNALSHVKAHVTVSLDVRNFYPSISKCQIVNVFKNLLKFSDEVANLLADLVTFEEKLPQGAATSSYLANLVFFDTEYKLVTRFRSQGLIYTRLLDDITVSSDKPLDHKKIEKVISEIRKMICGGGLKVNNKKTKIVSRLNNHELMNVTGLWVNHSVPKCSKEERKNIRAAVKECEVYFARSDSSRTAKEYHELWNKTSGRVAKLQRVGHTQASTLRVRLSRILPTISDADVTALEREISCLENENSNKINRIGFLKRVNNAIYKAGLVSRRNKSLAKSLRNRLVIIKSDNSYSDFWER